ncbi:hypothetical protein LOK49_LG02G01052 [Camellia lanceoleosa]|uniref:Uncharacterized protein n=1 Tax=Camellia lanceoleosa TaxID=1840588 RepID=A0ACC0IHQ5_9ERIC|nr:hypothetical protein LOK49_LG02G01052 [Camellia lanceoleosa]
METTKEVSPSQNLLPPPHASSPKMMATPVEGPKVKSFKEALATPRNKDFYFDELEDIINTKEDEDGETDIQDGHHSQRKDGIPQITLPKKLLQQIRQPWANALLIRSLGKTIRYSMLCSRVKTLWRLQDDFNAINRQQLFFI